MNVIIDVFTPTDYRTEKNVQLARNNGLSQCLLLQTSKVSHDITHLFKFICAISK